MAEPTTHLPPATARNVDPDLAETEPIRTARIEALSDGVFAISMTLLVLPIPVPEHLPPGPLGAVDALVGLWPDLLAYAATFIVLGGFWTGQHAQFQLIRRADHMLLWSTIVFLMLAAALPFTAAFVARHVVDPGTVAIYCGHLIAVGLAHFATWRHATRRRRLVDPQIPSAVVRRHAVLALAAPVVYLLAIPISFVAPIVALVVCALVPIIYTVLPHAMARASALRTARGRRARGSRDAGPERPPSARPA